MTQKKLRIANGQAGTSPDDEPAWQPEHLSAADDILRTRIGTRAALSAARIARTIMEVSRGHSTRIHRRDSAASVGVEVRRL